MAQRRPRCALCGAEARDAEALQEHWQHEHDEEYAVLLDALRADGFLDDEEGW